MERIFEIWPTVAELARDIGKPYPTVAAWKQRGSIPGEYDKTIVEKARERGFGLTFEEIANERAKRFSQSHSNAEAATE